MKYKNSQCVFWDPITSSWSSEGCVITHQLIEQPFIECRCNHLTNFAADATADSRYSFGVAMSVACAIVILSVLFSIAIHFCYYTKFQLITHLIMNLLVSLLFSEITFLLAAILSPIADVAGCAAIGAILRPGGSTFHLVRPGPEFWSGLNFWSGRAQPARPLPSGLNFW